MPFKRGKSKAVKKANFHEFRHGKRYAKIRRKYGKAKARKVMIAAVLSGARRTGRKKKRR